ncbi:MAG: hypothetical protein JWR16_1806 [Nevskia sp.]|nr:hypothetical protein [Nevskia sp.]
MRILRTLVFALAACIPPAAFSQTVPAGSVTQLSGHVTATAPGAASRTLSRGASIYAGEVLDTSSASSATILFTDQGTVALRPATQFIVEKYQFNGRPADAGAAAVSESSFFRLVKGGMRAVSGLIGHADYNNYGVNTPVATLGIRGTQYLLALCDAVCSTDKTVLESIPAGKSAVDGVISCVESGAIKVTSFTNNSMNLSPGQCSITLTDGSQYLLHTVPAWLETESAVLGTGVAAGSDSAAAELGKGVLITDLLVGGTTAALLGLLIESVGNSGSTATTGTVATHP